jgi:hypothetical protein
MVAYYHFRSQNLTFFLSFFLFRTTSIVIFVDTVSIDTFAVSHSIMQPITSKYTIPQMSRRTQGQVAGACCTNSERLIQLWVVIPYKDFLIVGKVWLVGGEMVVTDGVEWRNGEGSLLPMYVKRACSTTSETVM